MNSANVKILIRAFFILICHLKKDHAPLLLFNVFSELVYVSFFRNLLGLKGHMVPYFYTSTNILHNKDGFNSPVNSIFSRVQNHLYTFCTVYINDF